jgi:hypothetical protein
VLPQINMIMIAENRRLFITLGFLCENFLINQYAKEIFDRLVIFHVALNDYEKIGGPLNK